VSIPVHVDRAITKEVFEAAQNTCYVQAGVDLFQQAFATTAVPDFAMIGSRFTFKQEIKKQPSTIRRRLNLNSAWFDPRVITEVYVYSDEPGLIGEAILETPTERAKRLGQITNREFILPYLQGDEAPEIAFDRFQSPYVAGVLMKNITINLPPDGPRYSLLNSESGRPVLTVDAEKVKLCFINELQKPEPQK
jgi:hypothetical protein